MNYVYQSDPAGGTQATRSGLKQLLSELENGDCLAVARISVAAGSVQEFLDMLDDLEARGIRFRAAEEGLDTGTPEGQCAVKLLRSVLALNPDTADKEDCAQKGRKPIEIDEALFDEILERWKSGEITARQAMAELNLKPNTFYRRVKEHDGKSADALLNAAKNLGKEIVNTVAEGTEELQKAAGKCDLSSITDTVKKNLSAAGKVFSSRMDSLSRDFQEAVKEAKQAAKQESSAEKAEEEEAPVQESAAAEAAPQPDAPQEEPAQEAQQPSPDAEGIPSEDAPAPESEEEL